MYIKLHESKLLDNECVAQLRKEERGRFEISKKIRHFQSVFSRILELCVV
jgi:hypothetical protein